MKLPISEPYVNGYEIKEIKKIIKKNEISSYGNIIKKFENKLNSITKIKYVIACSSGTSALHVALKVVGVKKNDEVLVPTITFIATINSIKYLGANPIFFGCDKFFNIDSEKVIEFINNNTYFKNGSTYNLKTKKKISAIIPVHVWGNAANIKKLSLICRKRGIKIVEDSTEALGTYYKDKKKKSVGSIGDIGCLSFNGNKIITAGNGGALVTNNKNYDLKARYYLSQATDNKQKFIHNDIGYNYRFSGLNAAFGLGQLNLLGFYLKKKRKIHKSYVKFFKHSKYFTVLQSPDYSSNNNWMNILQFDPKILNSVKNIFKKNNIQIKNVWLPNHKQLPYLKCQKYKINNLDKFYKGSICLPSSINLNVKKIEKISKIILRYEG